MVLAGSLKGGIKKKQPYINNTVYHPLSIKYCLESSEDINEKTLLKHLLVKEGEGLQKLIFPAAFPTDIRTDCDL